MPDSIYKYALANRPVLLRVGVGLVALAMSVVGCGERHADHDHEQGHEHGSGASHGHSHGDDAKSFTGATYKEGEGITLLDRTRKILNIEVEEVTEKQVPNEMRFTTRVFASQTNATPTDTARFHASGTVPNEDAEMLKPGAVVSLTNSQGKTLNAVVERVEAMPGAEAEVIVSFSAPPEEVRFGDFLEATAKDEHKEIAAVVPRKAVVRGTGGPFVYVVNGDAYLRTPVETGAEANGMVEVKDGLLAGDSVVTNGALELWLVELRAVKGGQGCCPAPPAKGE